MPWDDRNAFSKFFVAIYLMYISALYLFINSCFVTFFVGITRNCTAFYNQFQFLVRNLNPSAAKKSLCELIQYHHSVKEYVFSSSSNEFGMNNSITVCFSESIFKRLSSLVFLSGLRWHAHFCTCLARSFKWIW